MTQAWSSWGVKKGLGRRLSFSDRCRQVHGSEAARCIWETGGGGTWMKRHRERDRWVPSLRSLGFILGDMPAPWVGLGCLVCESLLVGYY